MYGCLTAATLSQEYSWETRRKQSSQGRRKKKQFERRGGGGEKCPPPPPHRGNKFSSVLPQNMFVSQADWRMRLASAELPRLNGTSIRFGSRKELLLRAAAEEGAAGNQMPLSGIGHCFLKNIYEKNVDFSKLVNSSL